MGDLHPPTDRHHLAVAVVVLLRPLHTEIIIPIPKDLQARVVVVVLTQVTNIKTTARAVDHQAVPAPMTTMVLLPVLRMADLVLVDRPHSLLRRKAHPPRHLIEAVVPVVVVLLILHSPALPMTIADPHAAKMAHKDQDSPVSDLSPEVMMTKTLLPLHVVDHEDHHVAAEVAHHPPSVPSDQAMTNHRPVVLQLINRLDHPSKALLRPDSDKEEEDPHHKGKMTDQPNSSLRLQEAPNIRNNTKKLHVERGILKSFRQTM